MSSLSQLIDNQPEGFSLQQDFYLDAGIYRPGPYTGMESFTCGFIDWYLDAMK